MIILSDIVDKMHKVRLVRLKDQQSTQIQTPDLDMRHEGNESTGIFYTFINHWTSKNDQCLTDQKDNAFLCLHYPSDTYEK